MFIKFLIKIFFTFFIGLQFTYSQGKEYQGPEDPAGDIAAEKEGYKWPVRYVVK